MKIYLLLCSVLFIPLIYSNSTTVSKPEIANKTLPESHKVNRSNETKLTVLSEGGSLLPVTSVLALPKEKLTNLDIELVKNKVKPVVARKGVVYIEDDNMKLEKNPTSSNESSMVAPKIPEKTDVLNNHTTNSTSKSINKANSTLLNIISSGGNKTEIHKKPLLLSYDTLANMTVMSSPETSPETLVNNQIQSPNKELKAYAKNGNSHPGMIMPLVITILLVPMFAVLGYMALRRGQEAWKNRHYKRMDFLLDGMYND